MRKSEKRTIDGLDVTVAQLPPRKGFKLGVKLFKYVGPAIAQMGGEEEVDLERLKPVLMSLMHSLDDDELEAIMLQVFETAYVVRDVDGKATKFELNNPAKIDAAFEDKLPAMFQALMFALEVNFADFFSGDAPNGAGATTSK